MGDCNCHCACFCGYVLIMSKYLLTQRLAIGQEIFEKKINKETAAVKYGINVYTARDYLRLYKAYINSAKENPAPAKADPDYQNMSKDELIELIRELTK